MRAAQDGRVVLAHVHTETEAADGRRPEAIAAALSRALGRILDRVVRDLGPPTAP